MTETNKMLEECANYLLNTALCWAAWKTSAQISLCPRPPQRGAGRVRAAGLCRGALPRPAAGGRPRQRARGSQARLLKYESILLLVLRLLYLQKRESLSASADQVLVTVEEVQAELQKMNLPRRLDQPTLERLLRTCAGTIWPGLWGGSPAWTAASKYSPLYCLLCRTPTSQTLPPRQAAPRSELSLYERPEDGAAAVEVEE